MGKSRLILGSAFCAAMLHGQAGWAESLVDGTYLSSGDANGNAKCTLELKSLEQAHQYGDELFELESSGDGACEWSGVGMSKNFAISGGMVTSGGAAAFVQLTFPFGPAGKRLELTAYDSDGTVRNKEVFNKLDQDLSVSE